MIYYEDEHSSSEGKCGSRSFCMSEFSLPVTLRLCPLDSGDGVRAPGDWVSRRDLQRREDSFMIFHRNGPLSLAFVSSQFVQNLSLAPFFGRWDHVSY